MTCFLPSTEVHYTIPQCICLRQKKRLNVKRQLKQKQRRTSTDITTYLTGSEQYKYCIKPYFMHDFVWEWKCVCCYFFCINSSAFCFHLQLKDTFPNVVSIDRGMRLWAHSTQQQYCS